MSLNKWVEHCDHCCGPKQADGTLQSLMWSFMKKKGMSCIDASYTCSIDAGKTCSVNAGKTGSVDAGKTGSVDASLFN